MGTHEENIERKLAEMDSETSEVRSIVAGIDSRWIENPRNVAKWIRFLATEKKLPVEDIADCIENFSPGPLIDEIVECELLSRR